MTPAEALKSLPRRRPSRFIDEILELDADHVVACYTWREEDCAGHFPGNPVVPGVKMLEMSAQTGLLAWTGRSVSRVEMGSFKKMVRPGDRVVCTARASRAQAGSVEVDVRFSGGPHDGESVFTGVLG